MDGATFALVGSVILGIIGGIFVGYGWGRIAERGNGWDRIEKAMKYDFSQDAGA